MAILNAFSVGTGVKPLTYPLVIRGGVKADTLTGHLTLTHSSAQFCAIDPGTTARNVTLPAARDGALFVIENTGTAASTKDLSVKIAAGTVLRIVKPGGHVVVGCDNQTWRVLACSGLDVIADPGNAGAIPVSRSGECALVSAGAETRTLARPVFAGQRLTLYMDTDGGDIVITASAAVNAAGNTVITFNDAGDVLDLVAITLGGALVWRIVVNATVTLA